MESHVDIQVDDAVLHICLNRPEKKNALTLSMYEALANAMEGADADDAVRVVLVSGAGDAFTSGNDLRDFLRTPLSGDTSPPVRFLRAIAGIEKPVVAAVRGLAIGVGTTMLLHVDLVYAAADARFQLPFVNLGLVPEAASSYLLPRMMGHQRAAELLMLGEPFSARQAHEVGIVTALAPPEEVMDRAVLAARALAAQPPEALRLTKKLMKRDVVEGIAAARGAELEHFRARLVSPEAKEAMEALLENRPRKFTR